ncbi:MAG: 2TM domain-containing protein [Anaerolineae bacterium]|nr:2TM domain-containing protein [Anaerolineae bacterium]
MYDSQYDDVRRKVEKRYKERLGLIINLIAFVVFNLLFWGMWLMITPTAVTRIQGEFSETVQLGLGFPWPIFITVSWSVGIVAHFLTYYYRYGGGANKREDAVQREIEHELTRRQEAVYMEKPKNDERMRLTEDGELEVVSEDEFSDAEKYRQG